MAKNKNMKAGRMKKRDGSPKYLGDRIDGARMLIGWGEEGDEVRDDTLDSNWGEGVQCDLW